MNDIKYILENNYILGDIAKCYSNSFPYAAKSFQMPASYPFISLPNSYA